MAVTLGTLAVLATACGGGDGDEERACSDDAVMDAIERGEDVTGCVPTSGG